jgi:hypothetical protein
MKPTQRVDAARLSRGECAVGQNRIARCFVASPSAVGDAACDVATEELGDRRRLSSAQIEHPAPRCVPGRRALDVDVDVILERHVGADHFENVDL